MDERLDVLANNIVNYSLKINQNDRVLISSETLAPRPLVKLLIKKISAKGALAFVKISDPEINGVLGANYTYAKIDLIVEQTKFEVDHYDCFINIMCNINDYEAKMVNYDVVKELRLKSSVYDSIKTNQKRWVLLSYPSNLDAYQSKMTLDEYWNFALDAMAFNYEVWAQDIEVLKQLMENTSKIRFTGVGTDIVFYKDNIPVIPCTGEKNIPDGEIYTAPIKDSVNGVITYNTPSVYQGNVFHHVKLTFKDGKIIDMDCDEDKTLLENIFKGSEGNYYIGEFSLGLNPFIKIPTGSA